MTGRGGLAILGGEEEMDIQKSKRTRLATLVRIGILAVLISGTVQAKAISTDDIRMIPSGVVGSGNGTLDLRMFTFSGSEILNTAGTFDGDNGNNNLPNANAGGDVWSFAESYVTTAGKLKDYYELNFPPGLIHEIAIFLDLNETTGTAQLSNTLMLLDVILNPVIQGNPDPIGSDVSSGEQVAIRQVYTGGTKIAYLDPQPAANLPLANQGAGFADYAIFTGIDPFNLDDDDVLLFNVSMDLLSNGSEEVFLSGEFAPTDIYSPEPGTLTLLGMGCLAMLRRRHAG